MRPRIRTIKPELFKDESLWDLSMETGLPVLQGFVGLWCYADKEGRFEWRPRSLKTDILPYWDGEFSRVLDALVTRGFVVKYACGEREYGAIRTFRKHQILNNREAESEIPPPPDDLLEIAASYQRVPHACLTRASRDLCHSKRSGSGSGSGNGPGTELAGTPAAQGEPADDGLVVLTDLSATMVATPSAKRRLAASARDGGPSGKTTATWLAYAAAYKARHGTDPVRNAKVSGQLAQFVERIPLEEAPHVAEHYLRSNNARYLAAGHSVGCLLQDAEKLRTEWATGRSSTASAARNADRLADRRDQYAEVLARARAEDEADAKAVGNGVAR